jgi:hypothetical protein
MKIIVYDRILPTKNNFNIGEEVQLTISKIINFENPITGPIYKKLDIEKSGYWNSDDETVVTIDSKKGKALFLQSGDIRINYVSNDVKLKYFKLVHISKIEKAIILPSKNILYLKKKHKDSIL